MDREYTVEECYALCEKESACGGFFRTKKKLSGKAIGSCLLYRDGCTNDENANVEYYSMTDCQRNSNLFVWFTVL